MKISIVSLMLAFCAVSLFAQDSLKQSQQEMPKLEIPEITIVGKKAITLPFARKGEIYDVNLYTAPPPDSSLLEARPDLPLPVGALEYYKDQRPPWQVDAEGVLGTSTTVGANVFVKRAATPWMFSGSAGLASSQGHVPDADASSLFGEVKVQSYLDTDNDLLKTMRLSLASRVQHDDYGLYGLSPAVNRVRDNVFLDSRLGSVERRGAVLDFRLGANLLRVSDAVSGSDSLISVASPVLGLSFGTALGNFRSVSSLDFSGSSLNYNRSVQTPSVAAIRSSLSWNIAQKLVLEAGAIYAKGSGSVGGDATLLSPIASLVWASNPKGEISFRWAPELRMPTYGDFIQEVPYLDREISFRPQKSPLHLNAMIAQEVDDVSLRILGWFKQSSDHHVVTAESGRLAIGYADVDELGFEANGRAAISSRFTADATLTAVRSIVDGSDAQLPMTPAVRLKGRAEYALDIPLTLSSSFEYLGPRNIDLRGAGQLQSAILMGAGVRTRALAGVLFSLDISNLFDTRYDLWDGYPAPGIQAVLQAQVNIL